VLHAEGLAPQTPVESIAPELRSKLVLTAHLLLRANLGGGPRVTVPGGLAVYGRKGEPCPRCGGLVERIVQGEHARSTYWCPGCQHPPAHVPRPNRDRTEPCQ
jgi:endonuclease-8